MKTNFLDDILEKYAPIGFLQQFGKEAEDIMGLGKRTDHFDEGVSMPERMRMLVRSKKNIWGAYQLYFQLEGGVKYLVQARYDGLHPLGPQGEQVELVYVPRDIPESLVGRKQKEMSVDDSFYAVAVHVGPPMRGVLLEQGKGGFIPGAVSSVQYSSRRRVLRARKYEPPQKSVGRQDLWKEIIFPGFIEERLRADRKL